MRDLAFRIGACLGLMWALGLAACTVTPANDPSSSGKEGGEGKASGEAEGVEDPPDPDDPGGHFIPSEEAGLGEEGAGEGAEEGGEDLGQYKIVVGDVPCAADADCVPDQCCHPTTCVAQADAKDCSAVSCTMDCRAETVTCGGGCLCQDGLCAAKLWMGN